MENIYESRRLDLQKMILAMGKGAIASVAKGLSIDANYLSRCLYPAGKKGKKNIGDELVIKLNDKYPQWSSKWKNGFIDGESRRIDEENTPVLPSTVTFQSIRDRRIDELLSIVETMSDDGMLVLTGSATEIAKQHPAQAKQTPASSQ